MKVSADFKTDALDALRGRWKTALLSGFLASLLGAGLSSGASSSQEVDYDFSFLPENALRLLTVLMIIVILYAVFTFIVGGAATLGYCKFNLKLVDGEDVSVSDVFSQFDRLWSGFGMQFMVWLYTSLWSLLLVIPGIVKSYSYSMTAYILAEHRDYSVHDAINESKRIMHGNKWRLFCLHFSFLGWTILCTLPFILLITLYPIKTVTSAAGLLFFLFLCIISLAGFVFLTPYSQAATAAFYRDITTTGTNE